MKRKIIQIFPALDYLYAVADDGTAWRIIDPLSSGWVQLPELPARLEPEFGEERETVKPRVRIPAK